MQDDSCDQEEKIAQEALTTSDIYNEPVSDGFDIDHSILK